MQSGRHKVPLNYMEKTDSNIHNQDWRGCCVTIDEGRKQETREGRRWKQGTLSLLSAPPRGDDFHSRNPNNDDSSPDGPPISSTQTGID